jgi:Cu(I)-responsive transcriptional regulator
MSDARQQGLFNIGQASEASGVSAKMIRHYESIGVIPPADRTFSNYRVYSQNDVHTLQFVRRARDLGFSMKQIQELLGLWQGHRASRDVRKVAIEHVKELEAKIREMEAMKRTLETLAAHCHGDDRPECPILDDLAHHAHRHH